MNTQKYFEKMPDFVKSAWGNAQKRFTLLEGEARKTFTGTLTRVKQVPSVKKVTETLDQWKTKVTSRVDLQPVIKKVSQFGTDVSKKTLTSIGVATQTDIRSIMAKIEKLRSELLRLTGIGKPKEA